jgi:hypothetical protein
MQVGPRFELRIYQIKLGTMDQQEVLWPALLLLLPLRCRWGLLNEVPFEVAFDTIRF